MSVSGKYSTTVENCNAIIEKAKSKLDGIYKYRGVHYRVKGGCVTHMAAYGRVYEKAFGFLVNIGSYEHAIDCDAKVKQILRVLY